MTCFMKSSLCCGVVSLYGKEASLSLASGAGVLKTDLKGAIQGIREELDEHLDVINQTTEEVQANYEHLCRLDDKVDRLTERIEQIVIALKDAGITVTDDGQKTNIDLHEKEKEVFLVLYTSERVLTYEEIATGIRESEFLVRNYVTSLIQKGVPIKKRYSNSRTYLQLEQRFKELQAKTNMLNISQKTVKEFY